VLAEPAPTAESIVSRLPSEPATVKALVSCEFDYTVNPNSVNLPPLNNFDTAQLKIFPSCSNSLMARDVSLYYQLVAAGQMTISQQIFGFGYLATDSIHQLTTDQILEYLRRGVLHGFNNNSVKDILMRLIWFIDISDTESIKSNLWLYHQHVFNFVDKLE